MTNDQAQQLINLKVMEEARKESERRLKIQKVNTTIVEERKKSIYGAVIAGIGIAGMIASNYINPAINSNVHTYKFIADVDTTVTHLQALTSWSSLVEYFKNIKPSEMFTPSYVASIALAVNGFYKFLKHKSKEKNASKDLYNMLDNDPTSLSETIETHTKGGR